MTRPGDRSLGCLSHFDGLSASADSYRFSWHLRWYYRDEGTFPMRYTVVLELEADGGYVATVPALPGCVSRGTPEMRSRETSAKRQTYTLKTVSLLATRSRPRPEENTSNSSQPVPGETTDGCIRPGTGESPAAGWLRRAGKEGATPRSACHPPKAHSWPNPHAVNSALRTSGQRCSDRVQSTEPKRSRWPRDR